MPSGTALFFIIIFSAIGMGYIVYGKKQNNFLTLLSGLVLCFYTYFVESAPIIVTVGIVLMLLPALPRLWQTVYTRFFQN